MDNETEERIDELVDQATDFLENCIEEGLGWFIKKVMKKPAKEESEKKDS
jgi:hypothetical protein